MRLTLGQVRFGLCTHLFLPELVVTSAWCAHSTFPKQSPGIVLVFKEALIQFAVAILRSVWTLSALMGKNGTCVTTDVPLSPDSVLNWKMKMT